MKLSDIVTDAEQNFVADLEEAEVGVGRGKSNGWTTCNKNVSRS
jgi:hypothetical protein